MSILVNRLKFAKKYIDISRRFVDKSKLNVYMLSTRHRKRGWHKTTILMKEVNAQNGELEQFVRIFLNTNDIGVSSWQFN